ncbi:FBP domain-containing protein [Protaetiibacter mangrovi]|uniref:FBP domain-containing protein n=1 Tax=Protaetiibacter mangrovi TaxID=2970926 RepID=A0ABT1ZD02_9MICO|nr:FBP domain-containing protein [Protaetiibacter mangrovi]MCS0498585.1 FBP domain-containing protein [Protaetiibacter mangrovi]TPW99636.1 FBP domain-containing protein [Schumannella luteola]
MHPIDESAIRGSFLNASLRERQNLLLPADFGELDWDRLDFLGWRDRKSPQLGAQCSWCEDVQLPNDVVLFSTKRAGAAGRKGDTVGTLVCAEFQCSANVRKRPTLAYVGFDLDAERERRIATLREHVANFVRNVQS